jgi:putative transposase
MAPVFEPATPACVAETEGAYAPSAEAGQCWRIAVHTLFRRPVFDDTDSARAVSRLHRQGGPWSTSRCLAWVLMPECWQALVQVGEGDSLEWLVQRFKTASARLVDPRQRINGWLWERGFDAQPLRPAGEREAARKLVLEPVRAGLANAIGQYPYWSAVWLEDLERRH